MPMHRFESADSGFKIADADASADAAKTRESAPMHQGIPNNKSCVPCKTHSEGDQVYKL